MTRTVNKFHVSSKLKYLKRIIFEWISRDAYCKEYCIVSIVYAFQTQKVFPNFGDKQQRSTSYVSVDSAKATTLHIKFDRLT